jgi:hypothetical protein
MRAYSVQINPDRRQDPLWLVVDPTNRADFLTDMVVFAESEEDACAYLDETFLAVRWSADALPLSETGTPWRVPELVRIDAAPKFDSIARTAGRSHVAQRGGLLSTPNHDQR